MSEWLGNADGWVKDKVNHIAFLLQPSIGFGSDEESFCKFGHAQLTH